MTKQSIQLRAGTQAGNETDQAAQAEGRHLILDAAARLFREQGYSATSLREIAGECGMKAGSLYYHFESKDEIVGEVLRIGVERVAEEVRRAVMSLPPDADSGLILYTAVHAHLWAFLELQDYTSANVRIFSQVPRAVREKHIPTRDAYERYWQKLLQRCAKDGEFDPGRNLRLARLFLFNALNGSLEWYQSGIASVETLARELTDIFLDGLRGASARAAKTTRKTTAKKAGAHK